MALSVACQEVYVHNSAGAGTVNSYSYSVSAGELWIVIHQVKDGTPTGCTDSLTGSGSWTQVRQDGWAYNTIYRKIFTSGGTTTFSVSASVASYQSFAVYKVTGHDSATPIGAGGTGGPTSASGTYTVPAFTSTYANSYLLAGAVDANARGWMTAADTTSYTNHVAGVWSTMVGDKSLGATGNKTFDLAPPSGTAAWLWAAVEVVPLQPTQKSDSDTASGTDTGTAEVITLKSDTDTCRGADRASNIVATTTSSIRNYLYQADTNSSFSVTVPATTAGSTVAISAIWRDQSSGGAQNASVSMTGATFTKQVDHSYGWNRGFIFTAPSIANSGVTSFTFTGGGNPLYVQVEYIEIDTVASPTITSNTNTGNDASPTVTVSPSGSNAYIGFLGQSGSGDTPTISGFSAAWYWGQNAGRSVALQSALASGTQTLSGTLGSSTNWHGGLLAVSAPSSATTYVFDSDSASAAEAVTLTLPVSATETGSGAESVQLAVDVSAADTSAAVDVTTAREFPDSDAATGADAGSAPDVALSDDEPSPVVDLGYLTDGAAYAAETSHGTDAGAVTGVLQQASESVASVEAIVLGRTLPEDVTSSETVTLFVSLTDTDGAVAVDADYPIGIADADSHAFAESSDVVSFMDYSYKFCPPTIQGYRDPEHPMFRRIPHLVGIDVLKIAGTYRQIECPDDEQFAAATEIYLGGHDNVVHQTTADALTAAGYGAYLTRF